MLNKRISILTSLLIVGSSISVSANTLTTPTTVNMEASVIDAVVPTSLPIDVDDKGAVTVASSVSVVNNSNGPIKISNIQVTPKDGWSLVNFDKDYSSNRLGVKEFGFKINDIATEDGSFSIADNKISGGDSKSLIYDASISPQKDSIIDSNIADVVFTVDWDTDKEADGGSDKDLVYYPDLADTVSDTKIPMLMPRYDFTMSEVNGIIYTMGGNCYDRDGKYDDTILPHITAYNIKEDSWEVLSEMPNSRRNVKSVAVNNKIYVMGGNTNKLDIYDIESDSWSVGASLPISIKYANSLVAHENKIYCIGGYLSNNTSTNKVYVYDIEEDTWTELASLPKANYAFGTVVIGDKIYTIGGKTTSDVYMYDIKNNSWSVSGSIPIALNSFMPVSVGTKVYIIGGTLNNVVQFKVYVYDVQSNEWSKLNSIIENSSGAEAVIYDGKIYCAGGMGGSNGTLETMTVLDTGFRYE